MYFCARNPRSNSSTVANERPAGADSSNRISVAVLNLVSSYPFRKRCVVQRIDQAERRTIRADLSITEAGVRCHHGLPSDEFGGPVERATIG
jgi:hypothetical protein